MSRISSINIQSPNGKHQAKFHLNNDGILRVSGIKSISGVPASAHQGIQVLVNQLHEFKIEKTDEIDTLDRRIYEMEGAFQLEFSNQRKEILYLLQKLEDLEKTKQVEVEVSAVPAAGKDTKKSGGDSGDNSGGNSGGDSGGDSGNDSNATNNDKVENNDKIENNNKVKNKEEVHSKDQSKEKEEKKEASKETPSSLVNPSLTTTKHSLKRGTKLVASKQDLRKSRRNLSRT